MYFSILPICPTSILSDILLVRNTKNLLKTIKMVHIFKVNILEGLRAIAQTKNLSIFIYLSL